MARARAWRNPHAARIASRVLLTPGPTPRTRRPPLATRGVPARAAGLRLLHGVLTLGRPLDAMLGDTLGSLPPSDRGLAHAIVLGVLRRLPDLDAAIDATTPNPLPHDARARAVLRAALAQVWTLGTPAHAVVATSLALVEGGPKRLVHAVLARLLRDASVAPVPPRLPAPWAGRWRAAYGADAAEAIAVALADEPPLDLTLRDAAETALWAGRLGGLSLIPGHVRLPRTGDVTALPGFAEGAWWVQDLAASLPARLLGARAGEPVVDLCAAPGGKTLQLAAAGAAVTALDISATRLKLVGDNLARTGLAAGLVVADALGWNPPVRPQAVLIDAPCSATGTARRHPDVLYLKAARDFGPVLELQSALLARALAWLPPRGRAVYCVCSLEPEEGEAQIARALANDPGIATDSISLDELPAGLSPGSEGWLRTLPGQVAGGLDGFFIARLRRT